MLLKTSYSRARYTSDGVTPTYAVAFPYLTKDTVWYEVYNSSGTLVDTDYPFSLIPMTFTYVKSWDNAALLRLTPTPPAGYEVWVFRDSSVDGQLVNFAESAALTEKDLDTAYLQSYYVAQEALDLAGIFFTSTGGLDAALAAAAASATSAGASATAAAASAAAAAASAALASTYATNAANSATAAAISAASAAAAASTAVAGCLQVANNLSDVNNAGTSRTNIGLGTGNSPTFTAISLANGSAGAPSYSFTSDPTSGWYDVVVGGENVPALSAHGVTRFAVRGSAATVVIGAAALAFSAGTAVAGTEDTFIVRDAANIPAFRNGVNAQGFRLYNTFTDASNYERGELVWSANTLFLQAKAAGTGTTRGLTLDGNGITFRISGGNTWSINGSGHLTVAGTDNTLDIGASGANRPRSIYWGTQALASDGSASAPSHAFANGTNYGMYFASGRTRFSVNGTQELNLAAGAMVANSLILGLAAGNEDVSLVREAADTPAFRRGVNAQSLRLYNTFTDASNYERAFFKWTSNVLQIGAEAAGTGTQRTLDIVSGANGANAIRFYANGFRWTIEGASGHLAPVADNSSDIGAAATRARVVYAGASEANVYREAAVQVAGFSAGVVTIDCSLGNTFTLSVTASISSWSFTNVPASGKAYSARIILISDGTSRVIASPGNWGDNAAYSLTNGTSGKEQHFIATTRDGGTTWKLKPVGLY